MTTRASNRDRRLARPPLTQRLKSWWFNHVRSALASLGRLTRSPLANLMTAMVIGIALALPTGLYLLLENAQRVTGGWDSAAQILLATKLSVSDEQAAELAGTLRERKDIRAVRLLTREQAREDYKALSGSGEALDLLEDNPLPPLLIVRPAISQQDHDSISRLQEELKQLPQADVVELDMLWVKRLYAFMAIGQRGVLVIAALLALAVLLIVGNTIRLDIQNRRDEIVITKLIGATNAFIRRPFLYSGLWYGLAGGLIAWLLIVIAFALLSGPVQQLAGLYDSAHSLSSLSFVDTFMLWFGSALLGLIGSWLAVGRHLKAIEPR